jgi:hypothetical protein
MTVDPVAFTQLEWKPRRLSGAIRVGEREHPFFFESSHPVDATPDLLVPLGLPAAMVEGRPLKIEGGLSPRLLAGQATVQDVLHSWTPPREAQRVRDSGFKRVDVQAFSRDSFPEPGDGVACFFSGGVDSFYSVLKHREEITHLIFAIGFDLPLAGSDQLVKRATKAAREVAASLNKELVEIRTNVRSWSNRYAAWGPYYHGAVLAATGLLFQSSFRRVLIPASHTYAGLIPWGSHPLLDPMWSTEGTTFVHDGCEAKRFEKVHLIASSDVAMQRLRVCLMRPEGAYNCGRCEKCLRTMINLRAVGAHKRCQTLPADIDLDAVRAIVVKDQNTSAFVSENLAVIRKLGTDRELERALACAINPPLATRLRRILSPSTLKAKVPVRKAARRASKQWRRATRRASKR